MDTENFDEVISRLKKQPKIKIFATDVDCHALEKAAAGIYAENSTAVKSR
ncbi:MAG: hypothetical protein AAF298_07785 [Cyanobacteria bacterium P01_A01_bin.40]